METSTQDLSLRGEWTSASNAQADDLCKGRHLAQKGIPDSKSEDAAYGTQIHDALKLQKPDGLSVEQESTYEACNEIEKLVVKTFFPEAGESLSIPSREVRYWIKWADDLRHSGQLDSLHVLGSRALIVEYKMLPGEVPDSPRNLQLRDQAVLLKFNVPAIKEIGTAVIQPLVTHNPQIALYNEEALQQSMAEMYFRVRASNTPGQPRTPGELQCKYCKAKTKCAEYNQFAGGMVIGKPLDAPLAQSLSALPITEWTPQMRSTFCERLPVAQKWLDECKAVLKDLLKRDSNAVPGFTLSAGREQSPIINAPAVFENFSKAGGKLEDFMKCVKVG